jgi:hypothetical protein
MSVFAREFLRDGAEEPARPRGFLALFGKHPGWDDHVEDLPLATTSLILAKQNLYVQGIGGQVGSGGWARLAEGQSLPAFDHVFLWRRGQQFLAGRLWASTDGKRRAHFPMIAMVHCLHIPVGPSLASILAWLETVEAACKSTRSADRVRGMFDQCQRDFQGWIERSEHSDAEEGEPLEWGMPAEMVVPAVAEIQSRGHDLTVGRYKERSEIPSMHCRVPTTGRDRAQDLRFWNRLLRHTLHESVPQLFLAPRDKVWLDVIAGEPTASDLFALRAGESAIPMIGDLSQVRDGARHHTAADALVRNFFNPGSAPASETAGETRGWFSRLFSGKEPAR